jgi:outer membrane protein assembly factor BamD (BamD/ComL family)
MWFMARRILLVAWLIALAGCASTQIAAHLVLPPTTIIGDPTGRRGDVYDAYELFDRGDKAFVRADWAGAAKNYQKILAEYPDSEVVPLARYNLGLVFEQQKQWDEALQVYAGFPQPPGKGVRAEEVRLRRGICLLRLGRAADAQAEFKAVLNQFGVPPLEANEARVRLGLAAFYAGDEVLAEHYINLAAPEYERHVARGVTYARAAFAEGYFVLGEIYFRRFEQVALAGDENVLTQNLRDKAAAFVAAREYYTSAVRTYEPTWMTAALFRVGEGFELFYRAVMAVPDPADLAPEERPAYRRALADKMQPVLDKALTAYRRNLELAAHLQVDNDWVAQTRARYAELSRKAQEEP